MQTRGEGEHEERSRAAAPVRWRLLLREEGDSSHRGASPNALPGLGLREGGIKKILLFDLRDEESSA